MNQPRQIGFGIVGTGAIAGLHAAAIRDTDGAVLRAVCNRSPEKGRAFAGNHRCEAMPDLDALLARTDIDAVCVATPTGSHRDVALAAFAAGKHVLCEKPLETDLTRIDAMTEAARNSGLILAAIFQGRFGDGARRLKEAVEQGRFGQLALCSARVPWWRSQQYYDEAPWRGSWRLDGGGALMNQAIHTADLLQWMAGMPAEVAAYSANVAHQRIEAEDTLVAALRFPHGALGVFECATSAFPGMPRRIEISGDRGSAVLVNDEIAWWSFAEPRPGDEDPGKNASESPPEGGASDPRAIKSLGHRLQVADLVEAIRQRRAPAIPGEEGRRAVQLVRAIYESAVSGRPVLL